MGLDALIEKLQSESVDPEEKHNKNNVVTSVTFCSAAKVTEISNKNNVVTSVTSITSKTDNGQTEKSREQRRQKVLTMLSENPDQHRAFYVDPDSDLNNVIIAVAIRGLATCELEIPRHKYDPFLVLELIDKNTTH